MIVWIAYGCGVAYLFLNAIKLTLAWIYVRRYRQTRAREATADTSAEEQEFTVTVAQPILSGDSRLPQTLAHNTRSLSSRVQFFWMIDEVDEVALETALGIAPKAEVISVHDQSKSDGFSPSMHRVPRSVSDPPHLRNCPDSCTTIFLCPAAPSNCNPKSFKLEIALENCSTDIFVVLDDDTMLEADALHTAVERLKKIDLYTGLPYYERGKNFWGDCVAHFVNNNSALTYLPPLTLFPTLSINGMFYACKATTLRQLGGFRTIDRELCDDYAMHQLFSKKALCVEQGITSQRVATTIQNSKHYVRLMHRWNLFALMLTRDQRIRIQMYLSCFLGMPPILLGLTCLFSLIASVTAGPTALLFLVTVLFFRAIVIALAQRLVFSRVLSTNPFLALLTELVQPFHLVGAFLSPRIEWRGKVIRVLKDQTFEVQTPSHQP